MSDYDYLVDTDLIIEHLRQRHVAAEFLERLTTAGAVCFSVITEAELYVGARPDEIRQTEQLLDQLVRLNLDGRMSRLAANFRKQYAKSHGTELTDALIAATAIAHDLVLVTYNYRHFPMSDLNLICPPQERKLPRVIRGPQGILAVLQKEHKGE